MFDFVSCNFIKSVDQFFRFPIYKIISSVHRDYCTSSFPVRMPFFFFPYLIAVARISSNLLNRSGESVNSSLVLDLKEKAFNLTSISLSIMLAVGLLYMVFIEVGYISQVLCFISCCNCQNKKKAFLHLLRKSYDFYVSLC